MSKEKNNESIMMIPESVIDKLIAVMEKQNEKSEKEFEERDIAKENRKMQRFENVFNFVKEQMERVQEAMKREDVLSDKYRNLMHVYDNLYGIIKYTL